jgi:hypothetical protein
LNLFDGILALVICVNLGHFDEVFDPLESSPMRYRLNAQMNYFEQLTNNFWMKDTPIILFAYMDQLASKIANLDWSSVKCIFPDYAGNHTEVDLVEHIAAQWSRMSNPARELYVYRIYSYDTPIIGNILWGALRDVVVKKILSSHCTL